MRTLLRAGLVALAFCSSTVGNAQDPIPPGLRDWQGWVLHGEEFRRCPFLSTAPLAPDTPITEDWFRCAWPERLTLTVDAHGGTFTQRWRIYADTWVALPGNLEHWPTAVRVDGASGAVVAHDGLPSLRLAAGAFSVSGRFAWSSRPESLPLPTQTAIVDLTVDGQRIAQPERPDGAVWLGKRRTAEQPAAMEVQVYRLLQDDIPAYLVTRVRLNVAGDAREELLARVLPDGFTPLAITGSLPARLERDGRLRVQVRPGSHDVTLTARAPDVATTLARPDAAGGKWARDEIWSFAANDELRVAAAEGAENVDPAQANVPGEWQRFPAFRMTPQARLIVAERSRGLSNADDNRLALTRGLWLDFDHKGFTAVDKILGTMRRDWRLDMAAPYSLQSAQENDEHLLVTAGADGRTGVEIRSPQLLLTTVARVPAGGAIPATGWTGRFDHVWGTLYLPPGHRLIAALGADEAPGSWFERWGLWSVFGVLIVVVFVYWTAGPIAAAIAAVALALTYQEVPAYIWLWGNLLAALAVARAAPEGRFRRFAGYYRTLSFAVLALALLPFLWLQVRYALYPQLEPLGGSFFSYPDTSAATLEANIQTELPRAMNVPPPEVQMKQSADAAAAPAEAPEAPAYDLRDKAGGYASKASGLNSQQVVQRYASGTRLQVGPGIPAWQFNSYGFRWSGPVEASDRIHFLYLGPVALFFWRITGVILLALLYLWLAALSFNSRFRFPGMPPPDTQSGDAAAPRASAEVGGSRASVAWLAPLAAVLALGVTTPSRAEAAPAPPGMELLEELKTRITASPKCAPSCAELAEAHVSVQGDRLEVVMQVSALANVAVPMPHASDRWQLDDVSVDARASLAMAREGDASLWVPLTPGAHTVRLAGRLAAAESIQLAFPQPPRAIDVHATGWTVSGINEGRLVAGSLELARERAAERGALDTLEAGSEFPAFVRVERVFNLDLDWTVETQVLRVAPRRAALSVEVPLVKGESVLTPGVEVRNGTALVGIGAGESAMSWSSGLARAETLDVTLPTDAARTEAWNFVVNPQWHVEFEGFPAVMPRGATSSSWVFRFMPRPGETLKVNVTRPKGVEGATLAIDSVSLRTEIGKRSMNTTLAFDYRSTQGGRHVVKLPPDARVLAVRIDAQPMQLRPEKGELPLALTPGRHNVQVDWEESREVGFVTHPSSVDIGSPASNVRIEVQLPASRWPLFARGPGVGPAFLYWGELVVFVAIAWLLGRWKHSPLRFREWLLLGLGLSTQSWLVFSFTAAWLLAMRWREQWKPADDVAALKFNAVQALLALFTVLAISLLVFSGIRNGLLSEPDMGVRNISGSNGAFTWFTDATSGALETPALFSAPMWSYRLLFFVWAGWMAFALVGWLRWAFNAWKSGGLWK